MILKSFALICVFTVSFEQAAGKGLASWTIKSLHDRVLSEYGGSKEAAGNLSRQKVSVKHYIAHTYKSQYKNIFLSARPYISFQATGLLNRAIYGEIDRFKPVITYNFIQSWAVNALERTIKEDVVMLPEKNIQIDDKQGVTAVLWNFSKNSSRILFDCIDYYSEDELCGIALHEFAHIALRHLFVRHLLSSELKFSSIKDEERDKILINLHHLQEFEADSYFVRDSVKKTSNAIKGLKASDARSDFGNGGILDDFMKGFRNIPSYSHPAYNRRIESLAMQQSLLEAEEMLVKSR